MREDVTKKNPKRDADTYNKHGKQVEKQLARIKEDKTWEAELKKRT